MALERLVAAVKERVFFEEFDALYYFHGSTPNWEMQGFHFHNQYEILLFLCDGPRLEIGDRVYLAKTGDLFVINNKEYHRTVMTEDQPYNRYVLMFEPEILSRMEGVFGYEFSVFFEKRGEEFVHKLHLEVENLARVEQLFRKIETCINSRRNDEDMVRLQLSILELVTAINEMYRFFMNDSLVGPDTGERTAAKREEDFRDPILYRERVEQIKKYITAHVEERLDLDELAGKFYLNRYYLSHYFKKETGFTVLQYVTNQKIIAAKGLLKEGHSVTEVAARLAYNSDSHFIAVFKKGTGITPKKYAQSQKSNNV